MKNVRKSRKAFTMAEIMITLVIVALVTIATIGIQKSRADYSNKFMYYASFKNIQTVVAEMMAEGISITGGTEGTPATPTIPATPGTCTTVWRYDPDAFSHAIDDFADWNNLYWDELNCRGQMDPSVCDEGALTTGEINAEARYDQDIENNNRGADDGRNTDYLTKLTPGSVNYKLSENYSSQVCTGGTPEIPGTPAIPGTAGTSGKILAATGTELCTSMSEKLNTVGTAPDCSLSGTINQNFTTTNGMRWFNFGTPYEYIGPKTVQAEIDVDYANQVYTIYIDIDGANKGGNTLNTDIMKFYITRSGIILPAEDSLGANDKKYISAYVNYKNETNYVTVLQGVTYRQAVCSADGGAGKLVPSGFNTKYGYCSIGITPDPATVTKCTTAGINCKVINNKPGF